MRNETEFYLLVVIGFLCILLSVVTADAQQTNLHLPPVEYDKPYKGDLTVETVTPEQLLARCATARRGSLGCAFPGRDSCRILLVDEATMKTAGWTRDLMYRHERAHCNGWPQSHTGWRPYYRNERTL